MRALPVILAVVLSSSVCAAGRAASALVLDRASVVVVFTPDSEVTKSTREEPGFDDFIDDFEHYRQSVAAALHDNRDVIFYSSSATKVSFKGGEHSAVTRRSLSGYGFIVYVPGKEPVIFQGVATDDDVLCALKGLEPRVRVPRECGPNNSFKPNPLRGSA